MKEPPNLIKIPHIVEARFSSSGHCSEEALEQKYDLFEAVSFQTMDCSWRFGHYKEYLINDDTFVIEYNDINLQKITRKIYKKPTLA